MWSIDYWGSSIDYSGPLIGYSTPSIGYSTSSIDYEELLTITPYSQLSNAFVQHTVRYAQLFNVLSFERIISSWWMAYTNKKAR
ncbi:hypothetical protein [Psychrobacillus sp. OK028]|uniref:hypothetical protein n=1 Tax=Psychrobacillus sp. OK028 TaxID=1884359 RepID=UPI0011144657|nr:hypothetical protein [Psychrobacillus sp. OK028]